MRKLILAATLSLAAPLAMADSTHGHGTTGHSAQHDQMQHGEKNHGQMQGVHTEAKLNSINGDTVNISHGPIPDIGWPAMTMDLGLLEGAQVGEVEPGDTVVLMLEKGADGVYGIRAMMPMN